MIYNEFQTHLLSFPKLPHKFFVKFALSCANDVKHLMDNKGLKCLEVTELWLEGKATTKEVWDAADAVSATAYARTADYAAHTADYASNAACAAGVYIALYAARAAYYAAYTASAASASKNKRQKIQQYYNKFNEMLNALPNELSEIEKVIYDVEGETKA